MALPFIVGPHQCSLTHGPDGRPQVEVVLRIRLPLAEFFDALLLTIADQHPLFQQVGHEPAPTHMAPVKAGLQTTGHKSPPLKEEASPKRKTILVVPNQRGLRILPSMLQQLTLPMKSCWRYSRMPHDSLTRLRGSNHGCHRLTPCQPRGYGDAAKCGTGRWLASPTGS